MTKSGRGSPGAGRGAIGGNSGLAAYDAITKALAVEQIDQEEMAKLRELRKRHRKAAEGNGVVLSDLDDLYRHKDDPISEIIQAIKRKLHYFGAVFTPLRKQVDLFVAASESPEMQHAARHAGRMAGLKGQDNAPPPNLVGEDLQLWQEGFDDGAAARSEASKERKKELADLMAQALKNAEEGKVTDGTGKREGAPPVEEGRDPKAVAVGAKAAADFALDNPEARVGDDQAPPQPDWTGFNNEPDKWDDKQRTAFERWFALVPEGAKVSIEHPGVVVAWTRAMKAREDAKIELPDGRGEDPEAEARKASDGGADDGDGEAPEVTAGPAPKGVVYMLSSDEPFPTGKQATYKDGKAFSSSVPGKLPVYDTHPSDDFEASPEELEQQNTRRAIKERQAAETPDPADVAAGAAKLEESGFTAGAKTSRRRKPAPLPGERTPA